MPNNPACPVPDTVECATAWLFPGQGAQVVGMGSDLWQGSVAARRILETANRVLGYELMDICFRGPEERLRETEHAQPAIFATSLACLAAALEGGLISKRPMIMAGHSIGEYTALVAAEALSIEDGLTLVQERARLMGQCSRKEPGMMVALLGLEEATVRALCAEADVDICNLNQATQIVVGGRPANVARVADLAKEHGARVIELNVSGAPHSRLMEPAIEGMTTALSKVTIGTPKVTVIANLSVEALGDVRAVRQELAMQVAKPVRWHESMLLMASMGVSKFVEFGPSRILTSIAKRDFPDAQVFNISGLSDVLPVEPGGKTP